MGKFSSDKGFKALEGWMGGNDLLFLWSDRAEPIIVMPWSTWADILERVKVP